MGDSKESTTRSSLAAYPNNPRAIVEALEHQEIQTLLSTGDATLGLMRPNIDGNIKPELIQDGDPRTTIESQIRNLGLILKFHFLFDNEAIETFYGSSKENQLAKPPEHYLHLESRWHEFSHIMTSGTTTGYILCCQEGNAVKQWRDQIGHWNIEQNADTDTLRGYFGIKNYNNILHGSDDSDSALFEVSVIVSCLRRRYCLP